MKTLAVFSILLLAATMAFATNGEGTPGDVVTEMYNAMIAGDGEIAVSCMTDNYIAEMAGILETFKSMAPEDAVQQFAAMGIEIDVEDIPDMTTRDFAVAMFSSPVSTSSFQSAEFTIGEVTIDGDVASVEVTSSTMGETETSTIDVVKEEGQWKVNEM